MTLALVVAAPAAAWAKDAHVISYGGFGTTDGVLLRGRAHKGKPSSGAHGKGKLRKLASTVHAFARRDLGNARVLVVDVPTDTVYSFTTDGDGFYTASLPGPFAAGARAFEVRLAESGYTAAPVAVPVQIVDADKEGLVIVADIDDTIVETGVTKGKAAMIKRVATSNAEDMRAFELAADVLQAFADTGAPVLYVTAGPIELAPRTKEFLDRNGFPEGAIFFRRWKDDGFGDPTSYKTGRLKTIADTFAKRKLVFFGDNGEKDPELYATFAKETGQVAATYLRATLAASPDEPRYQGAVLFESWRDVARHAGKSRILRWMAAHRIALSATGGAP